MNEESKLSPQFLANKKKLLAVKDKAKAQAQHLKLIAELKFSSQQKQEKSDVEFSKVDVVMRLNQMQNILK